MTKAKKRSVVPAARFKATCLALLDRVERTGETFVVTKHGRPVARLVPLEGSPVRSLEGSVRERGDLVAPLDAEWESLR